MGLEVGGEFVDAGGQNGHLHFGTASIVGATGTGFNYLCLVKRGHGDSLKFDLRWALELRLACVRKIPNLIIIA
jgi:hypothetical protein